jgi:hydrogenase accessory protein HypB
MDKIKVIEIKESVFKHNELNADSLRNSLKKRGVYLLNVMSSPGSGKTTTLIGLINLLKDKYRIGVMEADIDSEVDAIKIKENTGVESIQIHTGGMCHLTAAMTKEGLDGIDESKFDLVILENVGNLVCPAEFDTGAVKNIAILSVPEGDDKPLKYPLMFEVCSLVVINKIDVLPYFDFDIEKCKKYIHERNPKAEVIEISAKTKEGLDKLAAWMDNELKNYKGV